MSDLYKTLDVKKDASQDDIKKSYRKLALKYHPDKNPDDPKAEEKFKEVSSAYDVLGKPDKRKQYDMYGDVSSHTNHPGFDPFEQMRRAGFGDIFGGRDSTRGRDIQKSMQISFMDAVKGCAKKISIQYPYECGACKGNGSKDGVKVKPCGTCGGAGKIGHNQGFMQILQICGSCGGNGHVILEKCTDCLGQGTKNKNENLKVSVPAGIENGMAIRLSGKGMPSDYGAENGDLYLSISVSPHKKFKRNGNTIYSEESIGYLDAILGTKIPINTIHGKVKLKIPEGTQPNSVLKISGKGALNGDHLVGIKVELPNKLSDNEKELLEKLKELKK